jgi:benzoyl-CoA reductase subunit C
LSLSNILEKCRGICRDPDFQTAVRWKEENPGGRVVGCFPVYTPAEIIHACGMLPLGVMGAGNLIEIDRADSRIQSFICSIARTTMELGLTGRLDFMDAIYFTSICDVSRNLSGVWKRNFPHQTVEYIHFPQNMGSGHAVEYYRSVLAGLMKRLEELTGREVPAEALRESIGLYNRYRELMRGLYRTRREKPWLVSAEEAYALVRATTCLPVEESIAMLSEALVELPRRDIKPRDGIRVILEGPFCEQPSLEMLKVMEEAGTFIVDDDLLVGWRWFTEDVPLKGEPLTNLAESYMKRSVYSSVRHYGDKPRDRELLEKCKRAHAQGVIFCAAKFCEPALLDYVIYKQAVEEAGIPYLTIEFEEKMEVFEAIRSQVETFAESLLFFA